ncbi:MAG: hypothetical protein HOM68_24565 [Gemmatimonadetes bacterium]|jgi:hypothetical protein|nr:hypothetical protein [Gemmatimonadota bacterium]MBT5143061.1 hypothetical protein [Gemmatimonadota bacterium]MBT5963488.1 hypothetical protein [Gemmatimonadota bacterium]MBT6628532.1 hypothetical protein [Gemmatimonadota bacterium]MBT7454511.1 hypothetical protein [Gemmatimonadota bacterium]
MLFRKRIGRQQLLVLFIATLLVSAGCGPDIDDHIDALSGPASEDAKMALSLARQDAIEPLLEAFGDPNRGPDARSQMADALYRLYLREKTPEILAALQGALDDPEVIVRRTVVRCLGDLETSKATSLIINRLPHESDDGVRQEILVTLGVISLRARDRTRGISNQGFDRQWSADHFEVEDRQKLLDELVAMRDATLADSLRDNVVEWLEGIADAGASQAREYVLTADMATAEQLMTDALELLPDSKNINQLVGKFHYDNGEIERGLEILEANGDVLHLPQLPRAPDIDGHEDRHVWDGAVEISRFYENVSRLRPVETTPATRARLGRVKQTLFLLVEGQEPRTDNLHAQATVRDENAWQDECVEVFFDANRDGRSFHQIVINHLGTIFDQYSDGSGPQGDIDWNADIEHAVYVSETGWTLEMALPMSQLTESRDPLSGQVWGFNLARIRITNSSEYGQWVPTYGSALRPDRFGFLIID